MVSPSRGTHAWFRIEHGDASLQRVGHDLPRLEAGRADRPFSCPSPRLSRDRRRPIDFCQPIDMHSLMPNFPRHRALQLMGCACDQSDHARGLGAREGVRRVDQLCLDHRRAPMWVTPCCRISSKISLGPTLRADIDARGGRDFHGTHHRCNGTRQASR